MDKQQIRGYLSRIFTDQNAGERHKTYIELTNASTTYPSLNPLLYSLAELSRKLPLITIQEALAIGQQIEGPWDVLAHLANIDPNKSLAQVTSNNEMALVLR